MLNNFLGIHALLLNTFNLMVDTVGKLSSSLLFTSKLVTKKPHLYSFSAIFQGDVLKDLSLQIPSFPNNLLTEAGNPL